MSRLTISSMDGISHMGDCLLMDCDITNINAYKHVL